MALNISFCIQAISQNISGKITNTNDEALIGASIIIQELKEGTTSNLNGEYQIKNIQKNEFTLITSYIGYKNDTTLVSFNGNDILVNIALSPARNSIQEIVVSVDRIIERTSISNISFSKNDLSTSQGLKEDPLSTLASLPGIGTSGDLFSPSPLYIRGGDPNENLFLLDNNKIYFPYYFGGQKSIFNTDVTESIELLTGGFPVSYGNHMSSVLNVTTRDGDMENYGGMISLGFYNAAGIFEGPIVKEKTSFLIAIRRTYLDLFLKEDAQFPVPSFGDITFKLSHILNNNHKLALSGISSNESLDYIVADPEPGIPNKLLTKGNNHFQTLQIQSQLSPKIYNKLSLTNALSNSNAEIGRNLYLDFDATQIGIRNDMSISLSDKNKIKTGIEWQGGKFKFNGTFPLDPLQTDVSDTTIVLTNQEINDDGETQRSAYVLYDGIIGSNLGINAGIRWDYNPDNEKSDFSPRIALNYQVGQNSKIRLATGIYKQFPGVGIDPRLVSEKALHYIIGFEHAFSQNIYGWIEGYVKDYSELVIFDSNFNFSNNGKGQAKGIEVFLRKEKGKLSGWISYAISHSERTVPLERVVKDFVFDQRHIFNVVGQYKFENWIESNKSYLPAIILANFRYADGRPYTPLIGAQQTPQGWLPIKGESLSSRNSDYINLNLRIEWQIKIGRKKKTKAISFFEAWNVLNRKNILDRGYQYGEEYENNIKENEFFTTPFLMAGGFRFEF